MPVQILVLIVLIAAGCTNGSEPAATPGTDPATQTTTDVSAETPAPSTDAPDEPAPTAEPVALTDIDRIDAAVSALNRDGTSDLIAWDILDSTVRNDGDVTLTLCGWTGDTVFDQIYTSIWNIEDEIGTPALASEINTSPTAGDCLNTQLINTALATVEEFGDYWVDISASPNGFELDDRGRALLTPAFFEVARRLTGRWVEDTISVRGMALDEPLNDGSAPLLYRRFRAENDQRLEVVFCHDMKSYGTYRGGVLIDDGRTTSANGPHEVNSVVLVPNPETQEWQVAGRNSLAWSDCGDAETWAKAASAWRPETVDLQTLETG